MKTYELKNGYSVDVFDYMLFVHKKDNHGMNKIEMVRYNTFDNALNILTELNKRIDK